MASINSQWQTGLLESPPAVRLAEGGHEEQLEELHTLSWAICRLRRMSPCTVLYSLRCFCTCPKILSPADG